MLRKVVLFITILILLNNAFGQLNPGINVVENEFWIVLHKEIRNVNPVKSGNRWSTGLLSLDAIFEDVSIENILREMPNASLSDMDGDILLSNVFRVKVPEGTDIFDAVNKFDANPLIALAEPIPIYHLDDVQPFIPNDPSYFSQWYLQNIEAAKGWGMWNGATPNATNVVIAIIDTGTDWDHPDLVNNIWNNLGEDSDGDGRTIEFSAGQWILDPGDLNGIDDDNDGKIDDLIGWDFVGATKPNAVQDNNPDPSPNQGCNGTLMHGTHVAGCASAVSNNNTGIASVGFNAKIMPVKVAYDNDNDCPSPGVYSSSNSYLYAAQAGADIINCSFGGSGYSGIIQSTINTIHNNYGCIIVAAAGNDNSTAAHYPSGYQNVISVAALTSSDTKASFSNYGTTVDISAPGTNILSTVYANVTGGYQSWPGTSMASPIVSGAFALLKGFFPSKSNVWLEDRLLASTDKIDDLNPSYDGMLGTGRVNIFNAIAQTVFPNILIKNYSLDISGNGDNQLNPGESAQMRVILENESGWNDAAGVKAVLRCSSPYIFISDSLASYPDIGSGSIGLNITEPFSFAISPQSQIGQIPFDLFVTANQDSFNTYESLLSFSLEVTINQQGWPQVNTGLFQAGTVVADINGDGKNEVVAGSNDFKIYAWDDQGNVLNGFPYTTGNQILSSPALGDVDGNNDQEIVVTGRDKHLYIINHDGTVLTNLDVGEELWGTPSIYDLDSDGDLEIIFGTVDGKLFIVNWDGTNWGNFPLDFGITHRILGGIAVGDMNSDQISDFFFGTFNGDVYAINSNDGNIHNNFPINVGGRVSGTPIIADLDGSGPMSQQLLITSIAENLVIINSDGSIAGNFIFEGAIKGSPAVADLDVDGDYEIIVGTSLNRIYALHHDGSLLSGFPFLTSNDIESSPVVSDINNSSIPEIIATSLDGKLFAIDNTGNIVSNFPIEIGGQLKSTPTVFDLDGDGDLEIILGSNGAMNIYDLPSQGTNLNFWYTHQGNYQRTSNVEGVVLKVEPAITGLLPTQFELFQNYPNPFNPSTTIEYLSPQTSQVEISIYNVAGQKIRTLIDESIGAGNYKLLWDGKNSRGIAVTSGVYYYQLRTVGRVITRKMILLR
jgi:subtilisin family serine protease